MTVALCDFMEMSGTQAQRLVRPRIVVVEPTRGRGVRVASAVGLVEPVAQRYGPATLCFPDDGGVIVTGAGDDPPVLSGRWHRDGAAIVLSAAEMIPGGGWRTFDARIDADEIQAIVVDGFTATIAHVAADVVPSAARSEFHAL